MASGVPGVSTDVGGVTRCHRSAADVGALRAVRRRGAASPRASMRCLADAGAAADDGRARAGTGCSIATASIDSCGDIAALYRELCWRVSTIICTCMPPRRIAVLIVLHRARPRGAVHRLSAAGLGSRVDRSGRLPAARRRDGAQRRVHALPRLAGLRSRSHPHARLSGVRRGDLPALRRAARCRWRSRRRSCSRDLPDRLRARAGASAGERAATVAAVMTALFPPLPYFGALVLTEVWTTLRLDCWRCSSACARSSSDGVRDFVLAGVLFSADDARPARLRAAAVRAGHRDAAARAVRTQPARRRVGQWAALAVAAGDDAGAVVHL